MLNWLCGYVPKLPTSGNFDSISKYFSGISITYVLFGKHCKAYLSQLAYRILSYMSVISRRYLRKNMQNILICDPVFVLLFYVVPLYKVFKVLTVAVVLYN